MARLLLSMCVDRVYVRTLLPSLLCRHPELKAVMGRTGVSDRHDGAVN